MEKKRCLTLLSHIPPRAWLSVRRYHPSNSSQAETARKLYQGHFVYSALEAFCGPRYSYPRTDVLRVLRRHP
jgi:hypothetical protein